MNQCVSPIPFGPCFAQSPAPCWGRRLIDLPRWRRWCRMSGNNPWAKWRTPAAGPAGNDAMFITRPEICQIFSWKIYEVYKISRWLVITSRPDFFLMINGNHPQNALFLLFSGWRIILTQPNDICYAWLLWSFPIFALPGSLFMNISNTFHQAAWGG